LKPFARILAIALLLLSTLPAGADTKYVIRGVDDPLKANILSHVDTLQIGPRVRLSDRDFDRVLEETVAKAKVSLRPYGYYAAEITGRIFRDQKDGAVVELDIRKGQPVIVKTLKFEIRGPGARSNQLRNWQDDWPLQEGKRLNQIVWEEYKRLAIEIAHSRGYLSAEFVRHRLEIDLQKNTAEVELVLETGPQFVMGNIDFGTHVLRPGVLDAVPGFEKGDPYTALLMNQFRSDLWKTGYFTSIDVVETEVADSTPPRVDLTVRTATEFRNRYTGALGFGSDTGIRLQTNWSRHPMSSRGDRLDLGIGWQDKNDEYAIRGTYRIPRLHRNREFWNIDSVLRFENQDLEFKLDPEDQEFQRLADGTINERHIRFGRLKIRNLKNGEAQLFSTPFLQFINTKREFEPVAQPITQGDDEGLERLLNSDDRALSVGIELGLNAVLDRGFALHGHRERAWVFHSDTAFGSDVEFTQIYASMNRSFIAGKRWKFIVRGEVGYSDAKVDEFSVELDGQPLQISRTRLPNLYRFKAGGSQSVRGYGFEDLSDNDIGSSNIITASAEAEFKVLEKWSGAVFVDVGNAFNDWNEPDLKTGIGFGVRWYSIAGPVRIDLGRALDFEGKPWRLHFTLGVPLL
jgi:translocation and assembly module TamA